MKFTEFFLDQLDREAAITRRVLGRVPDGKNDWKPHEKSMPLGYLASLVAQMPAWTRVDDRHRRTRYDFIGQYQFPAQTRHRAR